LQPNCCLVTPGKRRSRASTGPDRVTKTWLGVAHVGGEAAQVHSDLLIPCAAGVAHALENTGEKVLRALVVKLGAN